MAASSPVNMLQVEIKHVWTHPIKIHFTFREGRRP